MKRIRKHPRIDTLGNQKRSASVRWSRLVYLCLITAFIGSLAYYVAGSTVVLSADGIVVTERSAVDASYNGKIVDVLVKEGDKVDKGTPLLLVESVDMVKEITDLALRDSDLAVREGQLRGKLGAIDAVTPLAKRNAQETTDTIARFDSVSGKGVVSAITRGDALRFSVEAAERVAQLRSDKKAAEIELDLVGKSREVSNGAMSQLKAIYDGGNIRASSAGLIGVKVPVPGQVVRFGDHLMEINRGAPYVLAYLPDQYLFSLNVGTAVTIRAGSESTRGRIEDILTVADALPAEFQNIFRPRDRSRLVRVAIDGDNPFALSQKVSVTGCAFGYCWIR